MIQRKEGNLIYILFTKDQTESIYLILLALNQKENACSVVSYLQKALGNHLTITIQITMNSKELVQEIFCSKACSIHQDLKNQRKHERMNNYHTILSPSQCALSHALQRGNYMMYTSTKRNKP